MCYKPLDHLHLTDIFLLKMLCFKVNFMLQTKEDKTISVHFSAESDKLILG